MFPVVNWGSGSLKKSHKIFLDNFCTVEAEKGTCGEGDEKMKFQKIIQIQNVPLNKW